MVNLFFQSIQFCLLFILLGVLKLVRLFIYIAFVTNLLLSTAFRCLVLQVETRKVC